MRVPPASIRRDPPRALSLSHSRTVLGPLHCPMPRVRAGSREPGFPIRALVTRSRAAATVKASMCLPAIPADAGGHLSRCRGLRPHLGAMGTVRGFQLRCESRVERRPVTWYRGRVCRRHQWCAETLLTHSATNSPDADRLMSPSARMPTIRLFLLNTSDNAETPVIAGFLAHYPNRGNGGGNRSEAR